jgi:glycosyltransferase involved in cell wall biosynthesis
VGIRVAVIDDNPHVSWQGRVYPVNATFHRFLSAVLDVRGPGGDAMVERITHCVPLREGTGPPATLALDTRLEVVGTRPFDGIEGYLRDLPRQTRSNARLLRHVVEGADLVWIKVPASNGLLAAWLAWQAHRPRFVWVAGSVGDVVAAQVRRPPARITATAVAAIYDLGGVVASIGGRRLVVGADLVGSDGSGATAGRGVVTSLVEPSEISAIDDRPWPRTDGVVRLGWAGRIVEDKGVDTLIDMLSRLAGTEAPGTPRHELVLVGDGPAVGAARDLARARQVDDRIEWAGYVADRNSYLGLLRGCDLLLHPSPAEGFPKVVLDGMACGVPMIARPAGQLEPLATADLFWSVRTADPANWADAVATLIANPDAARNTARRASAFVANHTRPAEASRLVSRWLEWWPALAQGG